VSVIYEDIKARYVGLFIPGENEEEVFFKKDQALIAKYVEGAIKFTVDLR
jgi:hypothetical protein